MPNKKADAVLEVKNIIKDYKSGAGQIRILKGISFSAGPGEFISIVGKSGSGKTTLLNMITGIDRPTSGEIIINKTLLHEMKERDISRWRGLNIGIVFQFFQLLPTLTVLENVMMPMDFCKTYSVKERRERAQTLLQRVGLKEHAHKLPSSLSGGEQQRVAIARALANNPPLIVADEPTGNLDSKTTESIFKLLVSLKQEGKVIIMVTHSNDLAVRTDRILYLHDGAMEEDHTIKSRTVKGMCGND